MLHAWSESPEYGAFYTAMYTAAYIKSTRTLCIRVYVVCIRCILYTHPSVLLVLFVCLESLAHQTANCIKTHRQYCTGLFVPAWGKPGTGFSQPLEIA